MLVLKFTFAIDAIFIEREIAPCHGPDLANPEPAFIEHHDEGPVHGPGARLHHRRNFVRGQQVSGHFGHGVLGRCPEFCNEFPDLGGIDCRDGKALKGGLDCIFCQISPDRMKRAARKQLSDWVSHRKVSD
jgi:hypothetical protein